MHVVDDWMTPTAWGESLGLSKQGAHKAVARCAIPRREDGKVSKAVADALYAARSRPRARTRQAPVADAAPGDSYQHWRVRREKAEALRAEADLASRCGELVDVVRIKAVMARCITAARDIAMNSAARLAPIVAAETDERTVQALIDAEVRRMLAELAKMPAELSRGGEE